ncbi:MAG TPA: hypothetical protein VIG33_08670 [Pseudobdellovibrionaceae bacterium]|jgi:hypothetical protein
MKKESSKKTQNHKFNWEETWFLEKLEYKASMILELHIVGAKKEPPEDLIIDNVNLGQAYPLVWDTSKKVVVRFFQPLAFQRLDESFGAENGGTYTGERFKIYSDSEYLRYYSKVAFGIVDKPIQHYSFTCSDDIIDILSTEGPEIENIQNAPPT